MSGRVLSVVNASVAISGILVLSGLYCCRRDNDPHVHLCAVNAA